MQFAATRVFTKYGSFEKYIKGYMVNHLNDDDRQKLLFLKNNKWFYSVFEIREKLDNNFFKIFDFAKNTILLLQSEGVAELNKSGAKLFMTLLYNNSACYQTFGLIHFYKGLTGNDFKYFSKLLSSEYDNNNDYSDIIEKNPVPFYLLYLCANVPMVMSKGEEMGMYGSIYITDIIEKKDFEKECIIEERDNISLFKIKKLDTHPHFSKFYYNKKNNELCVTSLTLSGYEKAIELLNVFFDLDYKPQYSCTLNMRLEARDILNKDFPPSKYEKLFEQETEKDDSLGNINKLIQEVTDAYNNGKEYNIKELAEKYGVDYNNALSLEKFFNEKMKNPINVEGGLDGFVTPPPAKRGAFQSSFTKSDFFVFNLANEVKHLMQTQIKLMNDNKLSIENFGKHLLIEYEKIWNTSNPTLLQYTVYLLIKNGERFKFASSYAIEFIKIFGHVYFDALDKKTITFFVKDFINKLLLAVLYKYGLIEIKNFKEKSIEKYLEIKTTLLFNEWIKLDKGF